jgi:formiminoglutamase
VFEHVFFSFDVDSIRDAPGVSCPTPIGLSAADAFSMCKIAGNSDNVVLVDQSELNPTVEGGYRTTKLCAFMFYHFVLGRALRERTVFRALRERRNKLSAL